MLTPEAREAREKDSVQKPSTREQVYALTGMDQLSVEQQVAYEEAWAQHVGAIRTANEGVLGYYHLADQYLGEADPYTQRRIALISIWPAGMAEDIFGLGDDFQYPQAPLGDSDFTTRLPEVKDMFDAAVLWALTVADQHKGSLPWRVWSEYSGSWHNNDARGFGVRFAHDQIIRLDRASKRRPVRDGEEPVDQTKIDTAVELAGVAQIDMQPMYHLYHSDTGRYSEGIKDFFGGVADKISSSKKHVHEEIKAAMRARIFDLFEQDLPLTSAERSSAFTKLYIWLDIACREERGDGQLPHRDTKDMIARLYELFDKHGFVYALENQPLYRPIQLIALELLGTENKTIIAELTASIDKDIERTQDGHGPKYSPYYTGIRALLPEGHALEAKLNILIAMSEEQKSKRQIDEAAYEVLSSRKIDKERERALRALAKLAAATAVTSE